MSAIGVSIVIAAYRAHDTIVRAVGSLLAQSRGDWQAIVVADDGTDYAATLSAAGIDDARLVFAQTGGIATGAAAARNTGLAVATQPFVTVLDADDRYEPRRLERLLPLAGVHGAAVDNVAVVNDCDGAPLSLLFPPGGAPSSLDAAGFLATSVPLFPVVRRDLVPGWQADVTFCDDVVFNIQVIDRAGALAVVDEPLYQYRQREGSITFAPDAGVRAEACYRHVLARLEDDGLGIRSPAIRRQLADALHRKRARNAAYEAAFQAGLCANFQEFLALPTESGATPL